MTNPAAGNLPMITQEQIDFYNENGYLVVADVLSEKQLASVRQEVDDIVAKAASVRVNNEIYDLEDSHSADNVRVRRIKEPARWLPSIDRLKSDPRLLSILTALMGPDIRFQVSKLNMKSAGFGAPVQWHQDWAFYPHTNQNLLAAGVLLDDMTLDNGPLLVLPGSHKGPIYDHHAEGAFCGAINLSTADIDFTQAVALTGPAGAVTFHHVRAVHGSAANRSSRPRRLLLFQYTAVDAWPLVQPVSDINRYDAMIVAGKPTLYPRLEDVPVRLPLPPAVHDGSIYENQRTVDQRYFDDTLSDDASVAYEKEA